jgi:uncharacterized membrane protein YozB (DUF420 family)
MCQKKLHKLAWVLTTLILKLLAPCSATMPSQPEKQNRTLLLLKLENYLEQVFSLTKMKLLKNLLMIIKKKTKTKKRLCLLTINNWTLESKYLSHYLLLKTLETQKKHQYNFFKLLI